MIPLARKTLVHEWRRFLPSALAVAFSGLLLLVQAALVFGIFNSSAVYIRKSGGELWLGYPGTQSIELGRPIPAQAEIAALMDTPKHPSTLVDGLDTARSGDLFAAACELIPGGVNSTARATWAGWNPYPLFVDKGQG